MKLSGHGHLHLAACTGRMRLWLASPFQYQRTDCEIPIRMHSHLNTWVTGSQRYGGWGRPLTKVLDLYSS